AARTGSSTHIVPLLGETPVHGCGTREADRARECARDVELAARYVGTAVDHLCEHFFAVEADVDLDAAWQDRVRDAHRPPADHDAAGTALRLRRRDVRRSERAIPAARGRRQLLV